ncbi:MAG: hypothetical protein IPH45_16370 [Bacteroidales bacterium]|nr:hypothetical protein [Bacteroidales bacterium]
MSHRIIKTSLPIGASPIRIEPGGYIKYVNGVAETTESAYQPFFLSIQRISWTYKRMDAVTWKAQTYWM